MKQKHVCPKCDHREILWVTQVGDAVGSSQSPGTAPEGMHPSFRKVRQQVRHPSEPMRVARVPVKPVGILGITLDRSDESLAGVLQAYVCRACGYTELYTELPETIPVDGELVRLLRAPDKPGPYR